MVETSLDTEVGLTCFQRRRAINIRNVTGINVSEKKKKEVSRCFFHVIKQSFPPTEPNVQRKPL